MAHDAVLPGARFFKINLLFQLLSPGLFNHYSFDPTILAFDIVTDLTVGLTSLLSLHDHVLIITHFFLDNVVEQVFLLLQFIIHIVSVIIPQVQLKVAGLPIIELLKDLSVLDFFLH